MSTPPSLPSLPPLRRIDRGKIEDYLLVSIWGTRYIVRGGLRTPDGRLPSPVVCTVWPMDLGDTGARLITAYPD